MNTTITLLRKLTLGAALGAAAAGFAALNQSAAAPQLLTRPDPPLTFEENRGQVDRGIGFLARGRAHTVFVSPGEVVMAGRGQPPVRMRLIGSDPTAPLAGRELLPGKVSHFRGPDPARWVAGARRFGSVVGSDVYPGVDVLYYGRPETRRAELEYDFVLAPGTDADVVRLGFESASTKKSPRPEMDSAGDLLIRLPGGTVRQRKPVAYQLRGGAREPVACGYRLDTSGPEGRPEVRFAVGPYDRSRPLVIDPVLSYATYLGGSKSDAATAITRDAQGSIYLTGESYSPDFPTTPGAFRETHPVEESEIFVTKLSPDGSQVLYSTYIGTSSRDRGYDIAVDDAGSAYIAGATDGRDYPTTPGAFLTSGGGRPGGVVTKLDPTGSQLVYSTYLSGGYDDGRDNASIVVDGLGRAYVAGKTTTSTFPVYRALYPNAGGSDDGFLTRLAPDGSSIEFSTFIGGVRGDSITDLARDPAGDLYVTGYTDSPDFPISPGAFQTTARGNGDCFVTRFNADATALVYSTYLGGGQPDGGAAIAVDSTGSAYVTGTTSSTDFPAVQNVLGTRIGPYTTDAFAARLNNSGNALIYSTPLGGRSSDYGRSIALNGRGDAFIAGITLSPDFPTASPVQGQLAGFSDTFIIKLDRDAAAPVFSTYLGGSGQESWLGPALAVSADGDAFITGITDSVDFPVVSPLQPILAGHSDAFLAILRGLNLALPPRNLTVRAVPDTRIDLLWQDVSWNETAFEVERREFAGPFSRIATLPPDTRRYSDAGLDPNTLYTYRIRSLTGDGASEPSNLAESPPAPPIAPSGLTALPSGSTAVVLEWVDNSATEAGFKIERSSTGSTGVFAQIGIAPSGAKRFFAGGLQPSSSYLFRVRAYYGPLNSGYTNTVAVTTNPKPPFGAVVLSARGISQSEILLTWRDNATNEDGYRVLQSKDWGRSWSILTVTPPNATTYTVSGLTPNSSYVYRVPAFNRGGQSTNSSLVTGTTLPNPPSAPADLSATGVSSSEIRIAWRDTSGNETAFQVEQSKDGGRSFIRIGTTAANVNSFTAGPLTPRSTFQYRVRAVNSGGASAYAGPVPGTTLP